MGTISSLKELFAACRDIAKDTSVLDASLSISGTIPEVLRVILLLIDHKHFDVALN